MTLHTLALANMAIYRQTRCTKRRRMLQIDLPSVTMSNLGTVARHGFLEMLLVMIDTFKKSNEVKVQVNGPKVTSLQIKSTTLALEYFVTLKSNQMLLKYRNAYLLLRDWTNLLISRSVKLL